MTAVSTANLLRTLLLVLVCGLAACTPPTAEEALADAEKALASGDEQAARIHLMNLLQREEGNVAAQVRLAELDLDAGQAQAAELGFRRAARLDRDNARVRAGMAQAMALLDRRDEALKYLGDAQAAVPADRARLLAVKGALLQQEGELEAAGAALDEALLLVPDDPERFATLAQLDLARGRTLDADWRIAQALAIDPDHVRALLARGSLAMLRRQPTAAAVDFRRAADQAEKRRQRQLRISALLALVEVQLLDADTKPAAETIETLNAIAPAVVQSQFLRAALAARTGNDKAAIDELLAVLRTVPDSLPARRLLGLVYARGTEQLNTAAQYLRKASARQPNDEAVREALAAVEAGKPSTVVPGAWPAATPPGPASVADLDRAGQALQKGRLREALGIAEKVLQREPRNAQALGMVGGILMATGFPAGAVSPLENAWRLDPAQPVHALNLARAYLASGNPEAAALVAASARASKAPPAELAEVDFRLALVRKDFAAARAALDRLAPPPRTAPPARWLEADLLEAEGKPALAADTLRAALALDPANRALATRASQALAAAGKPDADQPLRDWLARQGPDAEASFVLAAIARGRGDTGAARRHLADAIAADPAHAASLNDLAWLALADGDAARALAYADRALKALPQDPRIMDTAGWVRIRQGESATGLTLLELAARLAPSEPEIQHHLAAALADGPRSAEARPVLESLLKRAAEFPGRPEAEALLKRLRAGAPPGGPAAAAAG